MSKKRTIPNLILTLIGGILLYFIVSEKWIGSNGERWKSIVDSDGRGYYAYLPAIFIYHDLNFDFLLRDEATIYGKGQADYLYLSSGQRGNKYFPGEAILLTPFFLLAWLLSWILDSSLNGYNEFFFGSVSIAALFYLIGSLIFITKLLRLYKIRETWTQVILVLLVFGTNVFHYTVYEPSMSHIYSFFAISGFLFFLKKYQLIRNPTLLYLSAASLGIIALIRPVNGIIILAVPFLMGSYFEFKTFIVEIFKKKNLLFVSTIIFTAIVFIQPLILLLTYGNIFFWPYRGEGFDFFHAHFFDTLFSYRKGLFIYTPLIFISILFIIPYFKKSVFASFCFIFFFLILNFILSSWSSWFYGGSYSLRAFLEFYPLFIIPFAVGINEIRKKYLLIIISVMLVLILNLSVIQTYQYEHNIIHFVNMDKEKYWKVFLRTDRKYQFINFNVTGDTLNSENLVLKKKYFNNFEGLLNWGEENTITIGNFYSPSHSARVNRSNVYSPSFMISGNELSGDNIYCVVVNLMSKSPKAINEGLLVVSFESGNNRIFKYNSCPLSIENAKSDNWVHVNYNVIFPEMNNDDVLKIYVWNDSNNPVYIDDFQIELYSLK